MISGFRPEEAAAIKLKASLHAEILRVVEKRKLKARQLEKSWTNRNLGLASYWAGKSRK